MRSRTVHAVATLTLLTCFVCPLVQMFDHWDHELQTGQDTEYTLVVVTLCGGAVCALAKLVVTTFPGLTAKRLVPDLRTIEMPALFTPWAADLAILSPSPPLSLRI